MTWLALTLFLTSAAFWPSYQNQGLEASNQPNQPEEPQVVQEKPATTVWSSSGTPAISLRDGQVLKIFADGVTAAYALNPLYVDVKLEDGFLQITGKFAGRTEIVIISEDNVRYLLAEVTPAAPMYPPGFIAPTTDRAGPVVGAYETRYNSDQQQLQNILDLTVQGSQSSTQLHLLTSTLLAPQPGEARVFLPSAFFRMKTPRWDLTLLDQSVVNSPLTVNGSILRGVHFQSGGWIFHAGYASLASFHGFLLPVQTEGAVGAGYVIKFGANSRLTPNAYYFFTPAQALTTGHAGGVASILYEYKREHGPSLLAEVGVGHGFGSALQLQDLRPNDTFMFSFIQKPGSFHSLSFDNVPGLQSDLVWNRQLRASLFNSVNFSDNRLLLPQNQQNNFIASETLRDRLSPKWSVATGVTYAAFNQTGSAGAYSVSSLSLPQTINYDLPHFGAGFQYEYTRNSQGFAAGNDFRPSFRASRGPLSMTGFVEYQTEAIAFESLFSEIPGLQAELEALGLNASNPGQIQALLQDTTFLQVLGLSPSSHLNFVPSRTQVGGNLNWISPRSSANQLNVGVIYTVENSVLTASRNWEFDASYIRQLGQRFNLSMSASLLNLTVNGQPRSYPVAQIGLRRNFSSLPSFFSPRKFGTISGTIFQDDEGRNKFRKGLPPLAGVEVVLDGSQWAMTDSSGFYSFTHVPSGEHFIEVNFHSDKPFWFTGPSKTATAINTQNNLGVRFAAANLIGYLRNDAENGVEGAQIIVEGASQRVQTQSDAHGRFSVPGLGAGNYEVTVVPDTVPAGYSVEELGPQQISLENGVPKRLDFHVKALRSISGQATVYDAAAGGYIPAAGVPVELVELSIRTTTNSSGKFNFLDLPSGDFAVVLDWGGGKVIQNVTLPSEPANIRVEIRLPRSKNALESGKNE